MSKYEHLLSPLTLRGKTLKNRLAASKFAPQYTTEEYDTEYYCRIAKNGASIVTIGPGAYPSRELERLPDGSNTRFPQKMDLENPDCRGWFTRMVKAIQGCSSLVTVLLMEVEPIYRRFSDFDGYEEIMRQGEYVQTQNPRCREATTEELDRLVEEFAYRAKDAKDLGADMVTFYMCYRSSCMAQSLSPVLNRRTDKYGGKTMKERAAFTLAIFKRVRELCGEDFLIQAQMSAEEDQPGYNSDDWVEYCKLIEDYVDIVQIRATGCSNEHQNALNSRPDTEPPMLKFAEKLKKSGCKLITAPVTGFSDPDKIEEYIANGRTDMVTMARRYLSDEHFYEKVLNDDAADLLPCLKCNECHGPQPSCAVNPRVADWTVYPEPTLKKKAAVIGGGISGMAAALILERRGHDVTLYEKSGSLGGQLNAACVPDFKWTIGRYLDFVKNKLETSKVRILLNTEASPDMIREGQYDAVICAMGSVSKTVPVEGADADFVWMAQDVFGNEDRLGHKVVVIGGADTGRDTALYLARCGHEVVMVTRKQAKLWHDNHVQKAETMAFLNQPGLSYIEHASVNKIERHSMQLTVKTGIPQQVQGFAAVGAMGMGYVPCPAVPASMPLENGAIMIKDGMFMPRPYDESNMKIEERILEFDDVVVSGGRQPLADAAKQFEGLADQYFVIGDNVKSGDIKACNASAYAAAMQI